MAGNGAAAPPAADAAASPSRPGPPAKVTPHKSLARHVEKVGGVYAVIVGDKIDGGPRAKKERRFLLVTAPWLFAMAPGGAVKRCWPWGDVELMTLRSYSGPTGGGRNLYGKVVEILVRQEGEKDLVLQCADSASENSHASAHEALDVAELVARPQRGGRPLIPPEAEHAVEEGVASLVDAAAQNPSTAKPAAVQKVAHTSHSPRSPAMSSPVLSPTRWEGAAGDAAGGDAPPPDPRGGPTEWEQSVLGFRSPPRGDAGAGASPPRYPRWYPPPVEGECPHCGRGAAEPGAAGSGALRAGMRVVSDGRLGTLDRPFEAGDLASPFSQGGPLSPRMEQAILRAAHWWVVPDPPGADPGGGAVLRRADSLRVPDFSGGGCGDGSPVE